MERDPAARPPGNSVEHLDPAVIRPGRFDRHIRIDLPDADARRAIFEAELDDRPVRVRLDELARETEGFSPADLKALCQEAALAAMARTGGDGDAEPAAAVTHEDFEEALGRLRAGTVSESRTF